MVFSFKRWLYYGLIALLAGVFSLAVSQLSVATTPAQRYTSAWIIHDMTTRRSAPAPLPTGIRSGRILPVLPGKEKINRPLAPLPGR
jgi:hypothetical protein